MTPLPSSPDIMQETDKLFQEVASLHSEIRALKEKKQILLDKIITIAAPIAAQPKLIRFEGRLNLKQPPEDIERQIKENKKAIEVNEVKLREKIRILAKNYLQLKKSPNPEAAIAIPILLAMAKLQTKDYEDLHSKITSLILENKIAEIPLEKTEKDKLGESLLKSTAHISRILSDSIQDPSKSVEACNHLLEILEISPSFCGLLLSKLTSGIIPMLFTTFPKPALNKLAAACITYEVQKEVLLFTKGAVTSLTFFRLDSASDLLPGTIVKSNLNRLLNAKIIQIYNEHIPISVLSPAQVIEKAKIILKEVKEVLESGHKTRNFGRIRNVISLLYNELKVYFPKEDLNQYLIALLFLRGICPVFSHYGIEGIEGKPIDSVKKTNAITLTQALQSCANNVEPPDKYKYLIPLIKEQQPLMHEIVKLFIEEKPATS